MSSAAAVKLYTLFTPVACALAIICWLLIAAQNLICRTVRIGPCGCYRYAEYQYVCSTDQIEAKQCFGDIDMYQLFDLVRSRPYLALLAT